MSPSEHTAYPTPARPKVGYVVKVYPRFSETFVVTEILAREAAGEDLAVYALRPTTDARFHPQLAQVQAPVTHLPRAHRLTTEWEIFARAQAELPDFGARLGSLMPLLVRMGPSDVAQAVDLALRIRQDGVTHLHVHFANVASWCAAVAAELTGIPFTVTTHAKDLFHEDVDPVRLREVLHRAHRVVAISDYNARHLRDVVGLPAERVELVRNGLELSRFTYRDPEGPHEPVRVLAVGRLVEKKGFDHLVEAISLLGADVATTTRIVGDGELEQPLRDQITALGLDASVHLLGPRSQAELVAELAWADVLVAPCVVGADGNADGLPTVILEAMACGVPVIATDVTGIPEAVHPGDGHGIPTTGLLLEHDRDGLSVRVAGALRAVADPFWPRQEVARAARAAVERDFDARRQSARLAALESPAGRQRVAYVCADPGIPVFGTKGASVHIQEIVRAWRRRGAAVEVYAVRRGSEVPTDLVDLPVHIVPVEGTGEDPAARERAQQLAASRLADLVTASDPDVVYERYSLFSTVLGSVRDALGPASRTVLEVNAPLIDEQRTHRVLVDELAADLALADQLAAADVVACVSEPVAAWVRERGPRHVDVRVVPNGVNTDRVRPVTRDDGGRPVVTFVGTLKPWHGVEDLLAAAALATRPWRLRIVGDGPQRPEIEALAARLGLDIDLVGAVPPSEVPAHLEGSAVAVAPYPDTGDHYFSPLKVYEYAAAGLPIVASRIGQIPEVVVDGRTGVLVPPSDPAALAAAVDGLLADPATLDRLGRAARALVEQHHSWDHVLEATVQDQPAPRHTPTSAEALVG